MSEKYNPVAFDPRTFAEEAGKRDPAFREAYDGMADEFAALAELLRARHRAGDTADLVLLFGRLTRAGAEQHGPPGHQE